MDFGSINWLAVIVSEVVILVIGSLWYRPAAIQRIWRAGAKPRRRQ